jgi:hypothetical protein
MEINAMAMPVATTLKSGKNNYSGLPFAHHSRLSILASSISSSG